MTTITNSFIGALSKSTDSELQYLGKKCCWTFYRKYKQTNISRKHWTEKTELFQSRGWGLFF